MKNHPKTYLVRAYGEILTKRPKKMDYDTYRQLLRQQKRRLRGRLSGFVVWKSKGYTTFKGKSKTPTTVGETWGTLVGPAPDLVFVND